MSTKLFENIDLANTTIINKEDKEKFSVIEDVKDSIVIENLISRDKKTINKDELLSTFEIIEW